jgi:hypothetical protein
MAQEGAFKAPLSLARLYWSDPDPGTRWAAFVGLAREKTFRDSARRKRFWDNFHEQLVPLLDDSDPIRRRGASALLALALQIPTASTPPVQRANANAAFPPPSSGPESTAELAERDAIRKAANDPLKAP